MKISSQSFSDKVFIALVLIFFLKIIYMVAHPYDYSPIEFLGGVVGLAVFFLLLCAFALSYKGSGLGSGRGSNVMVGETVFDKLRRKYRELAEKYEQEKNYQQAAYIYLKLLKDGYAAAAVLEKGQYYEEAASVYLKYCKNKQKAAECYESARSYKKAIDLYTELNEIEKTGDLYRLLYDEKAALDCYYKVVDDYKDKFQYVKASLVYRNKIHDTSEAQSLLMEGWINDKDATNCLTNYFENIKDYKALNSEMASVFANHTPEEKRHAFLQVLKIQFSKDDALKETSRDMAYEIISSQLRKNKNIASELLHFNKENQTLLKDISKFRMGRPK